MNIKEAEAKSGVSKRNIRYYEARGLLCPSRNRDNGYREYTPEDVTRLKLIRMLRMVDMPLDEIQGVLEGELTLRDAAAAQKQRLQEQLQGLETAIRFCEEFELSGKLDPNGVLCRMDDPKTQPELFHRWVEDYKAFSLAQAKKTFTFVPEDAVTTPAEFTLALCKYGTRNGLDLVVTKEGMYPEFTIGGIAYSAERHYRSMGGRVPVAVIRCTALHPEAFEPDQPKWKKLLFMVLRFSLIILVVILPLLRLDWGEMLSTWEGWVGMAALVILVGLGVHHAAMFRYDDKS